MSKVRTIKWLIQELRAMGALPKGYSKMRKAQLEDWYQAARKIDGPEKDLALWKSRASDRAARRRIPDDVTTRLDAEGAFGPYKFEGEGVIPTDEMGRLKEMLARNPGRTYQGIDLEADDLIPLVDRNVQFRGDFSLSKDDILKRQLAGMQGETDERLIAALLRAQRGSSPTHREVKALKPYASEQRHGRLLPAARQVREDLRRNRPRPQDETFWNQPGADFKPGRVDFIDGEGVDSGEYLKSGFLNQEVRAGGPSGWEKAGRIFGGKARIPAALMGIAPEDFLNKKTALLAGIPSLWWGGRFLADSGQQVAESIQDPRSKKQRFYDRVEYERDRLLRERVAQVEMENLRQTMMKNITNLASRHPHLYNEVMSGRRLARDSVVFGGQGRFDLLEQLAYDMSQGAFDQGPNAKDELFRMLGVQ